MLTTAFLVMQFIISAKAGLVNAVEGAANVRLQEQVPAGSPIETSSTGRVEVLLNPGSFLRLGENSSAVLDSVELTNIRVRILSGSAIIEAGSIEKDSPIRVTNGQLKVLIVAPGVYRFSENTASVLDGELRTEDSALSINKGSQIKPRGDQGDQYEESKIPSPEQASSLDEWNQQRSKQVASANTRSSETDSASNSQVPAYPGLFLYPGAILPYSVPSGVFPAPSPFSFFQWYNGGYSYFQPLTPGPPLLLYPPFRVGRPRPRPLPYPYPNFSRPPVIMPSAPTPRPAPHPAPSRPGISRGRR
jgi:hypothetical protein